MNAGPNVLEAVRLSEEYLRSRGVESPRLNAEHLLANRLGCSRLDLYLRFEEEVAGRALDLYRDDLKRRGARYPLQYILGEVEFCSLPFEVREGVFIPRPETELLVEWAEELFEGRPEVSFAEFGTGSGVIAGALASRHPRWTGVAVDILPAAASLAARNIERLGAAGRVAVTVSDGFEALAPGAGFDLIVSNPPYIPAGDIEGLQEEVSRWESREALDGGEDGLDFYPRLAREGARMLRPGGALLLEIGHGQAAGVAGILEREGYLRIEARKDLCGHERMIAARRR